MEEGTWLILADGPWPTSFELDSLFPKPVFTLACDGALQRCINKGMVPDAMIGDGDSVSASHLERYRADGGRVYLDDSQEENDLTKALNMAEQNGAQRCIVLGATGGDRQHELANLLACASSGLEVWCLEDTVEYRFLLPSVNYSIEMKVGAEFSLFAFPSATGVALRGSAYTLDDGALSMGSQGLHNRAAMPSIEVAYQRGRLMAMVPLAPRERAGRNEA